MNKLVFLAIAAISAAQATSVEVPTEMGWCTKQGETCGLLTKCCGPLQCKNELSLCAADDVECGHKTCQAVGCTPINKQCSSKDWTVPCCDSDATCVQEKLLCDPLDASCNPKGYCRSNPTSSSSSSSAPTSSTSPSPVPTCAKNNKVCAGPGIQGIPCCNDKFECTKLLGGSQSVCAKKRTPETTSSTTPTAAPTCAQNNKVCAGPGIQGIPCCNDEYECTRLLGGSQSVCAKKRTPETTSSTTPTPAPTCADKNEVCAGPGIQSIPCCDDKYECTQLLGGSQSVCAKKRTPETTTPCTTPTPEPTCLKKNEKCEKTKQCCGKLVCRKVGTDSCHKQCAEPTPCPPSTSSSAHPTPTETMTYGFMGPVQLSVNVSNNYTNSSAPLVTKCAQKYFDCNGTARVNFTEAACKIVNHDNSANWFWFFAHDSTEESSHFALVNGVDMPCICNKSTYDDDVVTAWLSNTVDEPATFGWAKDIDHKQYSRDFQLNGANYTTVNAAINYNEFNYVSSVSMSDDESKFMSFAYGPYPEDFEGAVTKQGDNQSQYQSDRLAMYDITYFYKSK